MSLKQFQVILEKQEEGGYVASVPSLPGCASQGETREEAIANIKEAISLYLEALRDLQRPLPQIEVCEVTV